jgi:hypothetical protein
MIPRGTIKKKSLTDSPTTTTSTAKISLEPQPRRNSLKIVTIKEPSVSPASSSGENNNNIPPQPQNFQNNVMTDLENNNTNNQQQIRVLKSTLAEQRRHLEVAKFAIESEIREKQEAKARALELEEEVGQLRRQVAAGASEIERCRAIQETQRREMNGLKEQLSQQLTTNQLLARAADEERAKAANLLTKYETLLEDFDANERVFKELLGALREKNHASSVLISEPSGLLADPSKNKEHETTKTPETWTSAWKQLQQRRLFEKSRLEQNQNTSTTRRNNNNRRMNKENEDESY